jgi:hypothetical protein
MKFLRLFAISLIVAAGACAQDRDFLTSDEADQIREAQEPNARLLLYAKFATARVALVEQLLAKEKIGRTGLVHDTLEDYSKIIEAIDTVADDALKRKLDITIGMKEVASAEKQMLATLQKLDEVPQKDYARYEFVLKQAIETTQDSADLSAQDLAGRANAVAAKEKKEQKELEAIMHPEEVDKKHQEEKKEVERKKKAPTLRRKGEEPKQP